MGSILRYSLISLIFFFIPEANSIAQDEGKYELRSTWVATVANIDWPAYEDRGKADDQKADLIRMLDLYQSINLNAIFLQVRPECDAFYNSAYEPWSRYLTWTQGDDPGYDPLQFAIEEAHKRGIEVHAWMNPYRISASTSPGADYFHPSHVYVEHPEWAIHYASGRLLLNPGIPDVMSYIGSVVRDLCSNYTIDGVHFDDYFYAYEGTDPSLDADEFTLYGNSMTLSDWRRDNINRMVDTVYTTIQEVNPNIRFGVSPFGIYKPGVPSGITGMDAYNQIYCDPLAWLEDNTVDYLTPQLYWPTGGSQDFETLANWWADQCYSYDRHLFSGHGTYRFSTDPDLKKSGSFPDLHENKNYFDQYISESGEISDLSALEASIKKGTGDPVSTWTLSELGLQIDILRARQLESALGSVFFSAKDFDRVEGLAEYLAQNKYTHPAIIPDMTWKTGTIPQSPQNLRSVNSSGTYYLKWDYSGNTNDRFIIYTSAEGLDSSQIISIPDNIKSIVFEDSIAFSELDFSAESSIVVTSVSSKGTESLASQIYTLDIAMPTVKLLSPPNDASLSQTSSLSWESTETGSLFNLEVSTNYNFSYLNYQSDWISGTHVNVSLLGLEGETEYFWRVKAKTDIGGPWSETRTFITAYPALPQLNSPDNLAQNISTKPKFIWTSSAASTTIDVEISETNNFSILSAQESFNASEGQGILSTELAKETWYYARIKSVNEFGESDFTEYKVFKTTSGEIPEVNLLFPADMALVASFDFFQWEATTTTGTNTYLMEVAVDSEFAVIMSNTGWISESEIQASIMNMEGQRQYYWRVRAKSEFGEGEFSQAREFTAAYPSRPSITSPLNLSEGNSVMPELSWTNDEYTDSMYFEFSEDNKFESITHSESFIAEPNNHSISVSLHEYTWYFARAFAKNEYGYSVFSTSKYFKTDIGNSIDSENISNEKVKIFPNPLSGNYVNIHVSSDNIQNLYYSVYDSYGREIISSTKFMDKENNNAIISLERNIFGSEGLYFIKVSDEHKIVMKPILIVK